MSKYNTQLVAFAITLALLELLILFMYGFFVRNASVVDKEHLNKFYPWFQDINVMMLIGFGYLMTFIKTKGWTALGFTFFINAIVFQLYILLNGFWTKVFFNQFSSQYIQVNVVTLIKASFCVAAVLISFGALIGRISPLELLILGVIQTIGYSLNQVLIFGGAISVYDVGGSMNIHTFGAYCGLACSALLGIRQKIGEKVSESNYISCIFAMIGTLFLWLFWPSFNSGGMQHNSEYQRMITIINTVLALTGSCIAAFFMSIFLRRKFNMDDVLNATLAGGVAIGSSSSLILNPAGSISIGLIAGGLSVIGYAKFSQYLTKWGIFDTCGINNLHGMPGILGGLASAVFISASQFAKETTQTMSKLDFNGIDVARQGGLQIAGLFISLGIGLATGVIAGGILYKLYKVEPNDFYDDGHYWEITHAQVKRQ